MAASSGSNQVIRLMVFCMMGIATCLYPHAHGRALKGPEQEIQTDPVTGQAIYKIKIDVDLVTTDVTVIGAAPELQAADFVILDNDVPQEVTHFSRDQYPLAVAIVIDGSLSIRPYLPVLQIAAASALRRLKPGDQAVLYSFNSSVLRLTDLTENRNLLADRIGNLKVALGSNIFGTIFTAAEYLKKKAPHRRRAIILVSDNCHALGSHSAESCRVSLLETATTLYNIRTPGDNMNAYAGECFRADTQIKQLAADTGGEVLDVQQPVFLQEALEKAISRLRMQYTLGFNPSDPGKRGSFHKLTVRLASAERCLGCRLLSRSGYYSGMSPPLPPPDSMETATLRPPDPKADQLLIQKSIITAGTIDLDLPGIPFAVVTERQMNSDGSQHVKLDLRIDANRIAMKTLAGKKSFKLHVVVFYADSKGKILGSEWRTVAGEVPEEAYPRMHKNGIPFSAMVPLKTGKQMLKVVVYDEASDNVGSRTVHLR